MSFNGARTAWDNTFESNEPVNTDSVSEGDDHFRQTKSFVRDRAETEHHWTLASSSTDSGRHRQGSAMVFYTGSDPAALGLADVQGSAALGEAGRLCYRTDTTQFRLWNGSAWQDAVGAMAGVSSVVNLLGGVQWKKAGADPMDIHAHGVRHRPGATDGAWTSPNDFAQYTTQRILATTTLLHGSTLAFLTFPAQTFGAAGAAKASITFSTVGRGGTSRGLLYYEVDCATVTSGGTSIVAATFLDNLSTQVGAGLNIVTGTSSGTSLHIAANCWRYVTGLSAGAHELALHLTASHGTDTINSVNMFYIDLGTEAGA